MADIIFDGTTDLNNFSTRSGSVYTLTTNLMAGAVTINSGVTLIPRGYIIWAKTSLTVAGILDANGGAGGNQQNEAWLFTTILHGGTLGGGPDANGGASSNGLGGTGGAGGSATGAGGAGGVVTAPLAGSTSIRAYPLNTLGFSLTSGGFAVTRTGSGGGGGKSNAPGLGGFGGGGGGFIIVNSPAITVNAGGIIRANGAVGSNATAGGIGSGGGGGGGGGIIILNYSDSYTNNGTVSASGGAGGNGASGGNAGSAGGAGLILTLGP